MRGVLQRGPSAVAAVVRSVVRCFDCQLKGVLTFSTSSDRTLSLCDKGAYFEKNCERNIFIIKYALTKTEK